MGICAKEDWRGMNDSKEREMKTLLKERETRQRGGKGKGKKKY